MSFAVRLSDHDKLRRRPSEQSQQTADQKTNNPSRRLQTREPHDISQDQRHMQQPRHALTTRIRPCGCVWLTLSMFLSRHSTRTMGWGSIQYALCRVPACVCVWLPGACNQPASQADRPKPSFSSGSRVLVMVLVVVVSSPVLW